MKKKEAKPEIVMESVTREDDSKKTGVVDEDDDGDDDVDDDDDNDIDNDNMENNNDIHSNIQGSNNNGISPGRGYRGFDNKAHLRLRIIGFLEFLVR